jgi:uncharacterized protein (TIGR02246 family)
MTNDLSEEAQAIEQLIERLTAAWNNHDAGAFSLEFAEDADFTNVFGQNAHGRSEIEGFHTLIFSTVFKDSYLSSKEMTVRFINPDFAAVDIKWEMSGATDPQGNPWPDRKGLLNLITKHENGLWSILIMHNMDLPTTSSPVKIK